MIKLNRPDKPSELTPEVEEQLVEEYKNTEKSVWRKDYITTSLLKMSYNKCCYCETMLGEQARPMQVEHYHCKDLYPDEVVKWENLLPSCSQCNSNKSILDTYKTPIIDPSVDNPKDYLYLKCYMIKSKDNAIGSKGRLTVDQLELNHRERLVTPRIKIASEMNYKLTDIHEKAIALNSREDGKLYNKSKIINTLVDILKMAQPDAEYSAFMATIILTDEDYLETKSILKSKKLWTDELETLHICAAEIKLDTDK
jgi:uncharacterized protein (TIGR02646 family)